jgi:hypothetical protein
MKKVSFAVKKLKNDAEKILKIKIGIKTKNLQ